MKTYTGTLHFEDLGAGVWVLETDDSRYQLSGPIPEHLNGRRVVVEGTRQGLFGFGMSAGGSGIKVSSIREP